jgi:PAS domain S-box-containing protein
VTLAVLLLAYRSLRAHLRPVAAIEQNLRGYADGVEQELSALMLSDALGGVAQGWNQLLAQLHDLRQKVASAGHGGHSDVLARFEGTLYRRMVDRLPFGVITIGEAGKVRYANDAVSALLRQSPDVLEGQSFEGLVDNPTVAQAVLAARNREGAEIVVDHTVEQDESAPMLRFRVVALTAQGGPGDVLVSVEDISQMRESERARDNFLYHVTHELRTPLTNIRAYTETLTQPGFDDEQTRKECYNVIISETQRLTGLVENILSVSQLEVGTARLDVGEVDFVRLLRQMVQDSLGAADEKQVDLTLGLPPKVPKIRGDKQRSVGPVEQPDRQRGQVHAHGGQGAREPGGGGVAAADRGDGYRDRHRAGGPGARVRQVLPGGGYGGAGGHGHGARAGAGARGGAAARR